MQKHQKLRLIEEDEAKLGQEVFLHLRADGSTHVLHCRGTIEGVRNKGPGSFKVGISLEVFGDTIWLPLQYVFVRKESNNNG